MSDDLALIQEIAAKCKYLDCPRCRGKDSLQVKPDGESYCHECKMFNPEKGTGSRWK